MYFLMRSHGTKQPEAVALIELQWSLTRLREKTVSDLTQPNDISLRELYSTVVRSEPALTY